MEKTKKRERNANFTREETEKLVLLIKDFMHIIENKQSDSATWQEKERTWKAIEAEYNTSKTETYRNAKNLKLKYEGLKRDLRKKHIIKTEGGKVPPLTPIECKVRQMLLQCVEGGEDVYGADQLDGAASEDPLFMEANTQPTYYVVENTNTNTDRETTVSNEVLDTVLKAGEVLKIRGLWRQTDEAGNEVAEKTTQATAISKQTAKKADDVQPKIAVKKDDKLLKTFAPVNSQGVTRPMFIGPPKLVFIKTTEGGAQAAIRPGGAKGQTILVAPAPTQDSSALATVASTQPTVSVSATIADDSPDEAPPPRILRRHATERKYGKRQKTDSNVDNEDKEEETSSVTSKKSSQSNNNETTTEIQVKEEPDWDVSSIEEEERSIAEMFQAEMSVKTEPDDVDIEEESLMYSPLACELCAEVFTVPAAWVRHVRDHAPDSAPRKRRQRSDSDDTEETMALLRCDLCQKHFPNPAEWVRHIQSTHTESELALSNNSAPPKRHNRFTEGAQNKTCEQCKKCFPSHASMLIHMRTHTGERPFVCGLCNKGFNVKSNLLRHLRTLHDQLVSPQQLADEEPGPSEERTTPTVTVKRES